MTFCLSMKVKDGLVGIADTRVTSGTEVITARKVTVYRGSRQAMYIMTSGLRSLRDKVLTYFEEEAEKNLTEYDRLFKAINAFAKNVRQVMDEDRAALEASGLPFDITCLIGGQMKHDQEHKLYMLYPQGNWVEVGESTPYAIIGATGYGKPVLDRTLTYGESMRYALKVGCLAFDSTRISAADVDFPIDVVLYARDSFEIMERRFAKSDMLELTEWWQDRLRSSVRELNAPPIDAFLSSVPPPQKGPRRAKPGSVGSPKPSPKKKVT